MFGWKAKTIDAQAEILHEGKLIGALKPMRGFAFGTYEYAVEVRLPGPPAQRALATGLACNGCLPETGDVISVSFDPKRGTATFDIERDERFDPEVVARQHEAFAVAKDALYSQLEDEGARGVARVVAVRRGRRRFDNVEVHSGVHVVLKSGDAFDTTIVEWFFEKLPTLIPTVGEKRPVLFDASDHSKIAWRE